MTHAEALRLDSDQSAEDRRWADPAVDSAAVVPDLEPAAVDRLDEMQVLVPAHPTEDDVTHNQRRGIHGLDRAELPRFDLASHRSARRAERNGATCSQLLDVPRCPSHRFRLLPHSRLPEYGFR